MPLDTPEGLNATYVYNVNQAEYCSQSAYEASTLIGTAFTARDALHIVSALGEDGMLRYWGSSYGTLLGSTMAAMFPDKIDRMVLDGNINPTDYYHGLNSESVDDVDAAVSFFFEMCASAGSAYCALADDISTGAQLEEQYLNFLAGYANGTYVVYDSSQSAWSYNNVKGYLYGKLKAPGSWGATSSQIYQFYVAASGSSTSKRQAPFDPLDANSDPQNLYATLTGITCGDWDDVPANGTIEDFAEWLKLYEDRSSYGGDQLISILYSCAVWTINAKEKYTGSFEDIETANPILFVNGHLDPVTPLVSAQNSSSGFVGSGVLNTNLAGHCSSAQTSKCVNDKIASYFDTGKLPDLDEICDPDTPAFLPDNSTLSARLQKRGQHDPTFEYPAAIRHLKRSMSEVLLAKRQSSSTSQNCTSLATGTGSSVFATSSSGSGSGYSSGGDSNGAAGRDASFGVIALSCFALLGAALSIL